MGPRFYPDPIYIYIPGSSRCVKFLPFHHKNLPTKRQNFCISRRSRYIYIYTWNPFVLCFSSRRSSSPFKTSVIWVTGIYSHYIYIYYMYAVSQFLWWAMPGYFWQSPWSLSFRYRDSRNHQTASIFLPETNIIRPENRPSPKEESKKVSLSHQISSANLPSYRFERYQDRELHISLGRGNGYISKHIQSYCWWLKSYTTWDVWNPINNGINYLSTGAGFQPSTVVSRFHQLLISGKITFGWWYSPPWLFHSLPGVSTNEQAENWHQTAVHADHEMQAGWRMIYVVSLRCLRYQNVLGKL